jgi:signal transduction histidine kinase/ActR/RegA family two-component response regulator
MSLFSRLQGRLYRKYAVYFVALVSVVLLASGAIGLYSSYHENRAALIALQHEKAIGAAQQIEHFITEIEHQIGWTHLPHVGAETVLESRRLDFIRLLRQAPAISEVSWIDHTGHEQLRVSRLGIDVAGSGDDFSNDTRFMEARTGKTHYSPVYFRKETEPYLTITLPAGGPAAGATSVEVNLKFVWDVISRIKIGRTGKAYVVDRQGQLISHPDISLVLQKTDLSQLPQVQAALAQRRSDGIPADSGDARDPAGLSVLAAHAPIEPLEWVVFVEQSLTEAYAPVYKAMARNAVLLFVGLVLAVMASLALARRMVTPIQRLQEGATRIGAGALDQHIEVATHDELGFLADEFNNMAARLRESYAGLEQKVEERTRELAAANQSKSRFLAAASHDLRQPMHALGLFIAQLRARIHEPETLAFVGKVESAVTALQELLDALLDISRLDAGVVSPTTGDFRLQPLFTRLEAAFAPQAERKGVRLRAAPTRLAVLSDPVLLERILLNLLANAVRYTEHGAILLGARRHGDRVRIEVWDTGAGIAPEHREAIFQEFFQVGNPERDRAKGLGLGLAIVARLARLLGNRIEMRSHPGKGSVFAVELPMGEARAEIEPMTQAPALSEVLPGARVLVVDDDALVREAMTSVLRQWGCQVATAANGDEAIARFDSEDGKPDAVLCDYRLPNGETGVDVIARLRAAAGRPIPAALVTGDTAPERLREAKLAGHALLHKPVHPAKLRALLEQLLSLSRASVSPAKATEPRTQARGG